jgi:hypothetical protein
MSGGANQPRDSKQTSDGGALSQVVQHNAAVAKNKNTFKKANKPIQRKLKRQAEPNTAATVLARPLRPEPLKRRQRREPKAFTRRAADDKVNWQASQSLEE